MTSNLPYRQYKHECLKEGADFFFYLPDETDQLSGMLLQLAKGYAEALPPGIGGSEAGIDAAGANRACGM